MPTDNFNRTAGGLGANWTNNGAASWETDGDDAFSSTLGFAWWDASAFAADHYSQVVYLPTNDSWCGPATRVQAVASTGYVAYGSGGANNVQFSKFVAGTETGLFNGGGDPTNVTIRVESEGSTHRVYRAGGLITTQTDSAITGGAAGMWTEGIASGLLDDWDGGDIGAAAGHPAMRRWGGIPGMNQYSGRGNW